MYMCVCIDCGVRSQQTTTTTTRKQLSEQLSVSPNGGTCKHTNKHSLLHTHGIYGHTALWGVSAHVFVLLAKLQNINRHNVLPFVLEVLHSEIQLNF